MKEKLELMLSNLNEMDMDAQIYSNQSIESGRLETDRLAYSAGEQYIIGVVRDWIQAMIVEISASRI